MQVRKRVCAAWVECRVGARCGRFPDRRSLTLPATCHPIHPCLLLRASSSFPDTSERLRAAGLSAGSAFRRGNALVWQLASVMVMQKWTDLTASEVETQVSMSCIEHADLLHAIREGTGGMHSTTLGLVSSLLQRVGALENLVLDKQSELDAMRAEMQVHESKMEQLFQQKLESATAKLTAERDDAESYATDARAQVSRLQDALSTLNSIYKQLREDNDTVRVADLRDACSRLETRLKERDAQVTMLNKIRSELRHANMLVRTYVHVLWLAPTATAPSHCLADALLTHSAVPRPPFLSLPDPQVQGRERAASAGAGGDPGRAHQPQRASTGGDAA